MEFACAALWIVVMLKVLIKEIDGQTFTSNDIRRTSKRISLDTYNNNQYETNEGDLDIILSDDNLNEISPANPSIGNDDRGLIDTIPGEPERDYPNYKTIPKTSFSCKGRVNWGYYADVETNCQVFHVCESEFAKISFLCPAGSAFNQKHLVCDWWYNFDCHDTISLTSLYDEYIAEAAGDGVDDGNRLSQEQNAKTTVKRHRNGHADRRYEDYEDDADGVDGKENVLYDLNPASSGGNA